MSTVVSALLTFLAPWFYSRRTLQVEILALRHQRAIYQCAVPRPCIQLFWSWLTRARSG